jgi:nitronate monooxygenase
MIGYKLPVLVAPMFLVSSVEMVVEACRSGVGATLPASNARSAAGLSAALRKIGESLAGVEASGPFAVNINVKKDRYDDLDEIVAVCREAGVPLVITSVGDPREMVERVHDWGGLVFHDVTTVRHAEKAAEAGVDGLILVCAGAGGHSGGLSPFAFVPRVRRFFNKTIVVAGAISDGAGIAAVRMLGADLVYMGTRFIASVESLASPEYKAMLLNSDLADVLYTPAISGLPANFLKPSIRSHGLDPDNLPPPKGLFKADLPEGLKAWKHLWSAGQGVGLIDDIPTTAEIIHRLAEEMRLAEDLYKTNA